MYSKYLSATKMLNYQSPAIQSLIFSRKWNNMDEYHKIDGAYNFVQNEILFGYNRTDTLVATQVLEDGFGQCNTKSTLLMALLRAIGMPCRLHGFSVSKDFQQGATTGLIALMAPKTIIHTWVEVYYTGRWIVLEGVITDKQYIKAVKSKFPNVVGEFKKYAIATSNFEKLSVEWKGTDTYVQNAAIVEDYGTFLCPDDFFLIHSQSLGTIKGFMYEIIGRKMMTRNVNRIRNSSS